MKIPQVALLIARVTALLGVLFTLTSDKMNGNRSRNGNDNAKSCLFSSGPVYTYTFMDFVTKMKDPAENVAPESEYIFKNGLLRPMYVNPRIGGDIPNDLKTFQTDGEFRYIKGIRQRPPVIPRFDAPLSPWGIDLKKAKKEIIPYNIESVRKQQRDMTPLMHWIQTHPAEYCRNKPQFACNRHIVKKMMSLSVADPVFTFTAERIDGTIFLRETHEAYKNPPNSQALPGAVFESVMLRDDDNVLNDVYDLNESSYGIFLGKVQNISILFSAEVDGFWGTGSDNWRATTTPKRFDNMDDRIAEVKTIHVDLFSDALSQEYKSKMLASWIQSYLVGLDRIVFGIVDNNKVAWLQEMKLVEIQRSLKGIDGCNKSDQVGMYTSRLFDTLRSVLDVVTEDSPVQYNVTTQYEKTGYRKSFTIVTKIAPLVNRPLLTKEECYFT